MLIAGAILFSTATGALMLRLPLVGTGTATPWAQVMPHIIRDRGVREALAATLLVVPQAVAVAYQLNVLRGPLGLAVDRITALTLGAIVLSIIAIRTLS